jgi:hypothetical protein
MTFMDNLINQNRKTVTTNGDVAYSTTLNANLDFFGSAGSIPVNKNNVPHEFMNLFTKAYREDSETALKNALYYRDIRGGLGRREGYRQILVYLAKTNVEDFKRLVVLTAMYGRYDDLTKIVWLLPNEAQAFLVEFISTVFKEDLANVASGNITLLGKWMPSANTKVVVTRQLGLFWAARLRMSEREYRKALSQLRSKINIIETKLTKRDYTFDYSKIPSRAMMKYTQAFIRNDEARYNEFKNQISDNPSVVAKKVAQLYPYEIIRKLDSDRQLAEALWSAYPQDKFDGNIIVVRDGSGSMYGGYGDANPIEIADSMAIYTAERLAGKFKNRFITFSNRPQLVDLSKVKTLKDKVELLHEHNEIANTNMSATMKLIYDSSLGLPVEEQLDTILIISDMQFDAGVRNCSESVMDSWKEKFINSDLKWPEIVYWNVNQSKVTFPTSKYDNVKLVSGFSKSVLEDVMTNETTSATEYMMKVLSRYNP